MTDKRHIHIYLAESRGKKMDPLFSRVVELKPGENLLVETLSTDDRDGEGVKVIFEFKMAAKK